MPAFPRRFQEFLSPSMSQGIHGDVAGSTGGSVVPRAGLPPLRGDAGRRRQAAGWRQGAPGVLGPQTGLAWSPRTWARTQKEDAYDTDAESPEHEDDIYGDIVFPLAWLQFAVHTGGVGRLCSLRHVTDTLRRRSEEPNGSSWGRSSQADETSGSSARDLHHPLRSRERGSPHPPRPATAAAPLYSTLGGGPRPSREGGGCARRAARRCPVPGARPSPPSPRIAASRTQAPNGDAVCGCPLRRSRPGAAKWSVAPARPGRLCACVRAGEPASEGAQGARVPGKGSGGGRAPALTARAERTKPLASPLTRTPPAPLSSHPHLPGPLELADWSTGQKFLWRRLGADVTGRIVPFRDPGGWAHAAGCRFAAGGGSRAGRQPGGGKEHSASRWGDDSGRVSMEIPLGLA